MEVQHQPSACTQPNACNKEVIHNRDGLCTSRTGLMSVIWFRAFTRGLRPSGRQGFEIRAVLAKREHFL
jgi:hypothetical protein